MFLSETENIYLFFFIHLVDSVLLILVVTVLNVELLACLFQFFLIYCVSPLPPLLLLGVYFVCVCGGDGVVKSFVAITLITMLLYNELYLSTLFFLQGAYHMIKAIENCKILFKELIHALLV